MDFEADATEDEDAAVKEYEAQLGEAEGMAVMNPQAETSGEGNEESPKEIHIEPTGEASEAWEAILGQISSLLQKLEAEISVLEKTIRMLPRQNEQLQNATAQIECIAKGLSGDIRAKSLEQYQGILRNVGENFNRLQQEADQWQKQHEKKLYEKKAQSYSAVIWSAVSMPVLMVLFFSYLMWGK